jgi:predicted anti-sigma-YlaC factor YlaD
MGRITSTDQLATKDYVSSAISDTKKWVSDNYSNDHVQVNPDWTATSGAAQILNKPTTIAGYGITDAYTKTDVDNKDSSTLSSAKSYTDTAIANLVNSAPSTLDTLKEIADQLSHDESTVSALTNVVGTKAPIDSPSFTGTPVAPTADATTNTDQIATTKFVTGAISDTKTWISKQPFYNALPQVSSDWTATSGVAQILNKPTTVAGYGITDSYTKSDVDTALKSKAPIDSPTFTGTPIAPTPDASTNTDQLATTKFVSGAISDTKTWISKQPFYNALPQVSSDWSATSGVAQILNKPTTIAGYGITDAYTKTDVDNKDSSTLSSAKSYTDTAIANLVDSAPSTLDTLKEIADQMSKDESGVSALTNVVGTKAPLDSPAFTGTPTAPTADASTNTDQLATTKFVAGAISDTKKWVNDNYGDDKTQVNSDWSATSGVAQILNKPTTIAGYGITDAYTKSDVDTALSAKAPIDSPTFTGTPIAPTADASTNTDQVATTKFVSGAISDTKTWISKQPFAGALPQVSSDWSATSGVAQILNKPTTIAGYGITDAYTKTDVDNKDSSTLSSAKSYTDTAIANLVNSAPSTLDTLKEIADQLTNDESAVSALTNVVGTKAPLDSPTFTGTPKAPTPTSGDNTTQIATTEFVSGAISDTKKWVNDNYGNGKSQVNADWSATSGVAQILNKPTTVAGYGITDVYSKTDVDTALSAKAPISSPTFTGTPIAPTADSSTNTDQIATTKFVAGAISDTKKWVSDNYNNQPQVNSDWSATSGVAQILNKPTTVSGYGITDAYTKTDVDNKDTSTLSSAKSYTDTAIANLVNSAPSTLDTLKEIADQLSKDESTVSALTNVVGTKAPIDSPSFTGTPVAPTADSGTNTTQIATTAFVTGAINSYIPSKLATGRVLKVTGDISFTTPTFDGSSDISATATLPDVVTAGSYNYITVNSKGLITSGTKLPAYTQELTADDGQTQITLNGPKGSCFAVFKNGVRIPSTAWSVDGTTLTFNDSLSKGDTIIIDSSN